MTEARRLELAGEYQRLARFHWHRAQSLPPLEKLGALWLAEGNYKLARVLMGIELTRRSI